MREGKLLNIPIGSHTKQASPKKMRKKTKNKTKQNKTTSKKVMPMLTLTHKPGKEQSYLHRLNLPSTCKRK